MAFGAKSNCYCSSQKLTPTQHNPEIQEKIPRMNSQTSKGEGDTEVLIDSNMNNSGDNDVRHSIKQIITNIFLNPKLKQWAQIKRENLQPWGEFFNSTKFSPPQSLREGGQRLINNIEHFQSNYLMVFFLIFACCLLTNFELIIVLFASLGACYLVYLRAATINYSIMGYEIKLIHVLAFIGMITVLILFHLGASSVVFLIFGLSTLFIGLHGFFLASPEKYSSVNNV